MREGSGRDRSRSQGKIEATLRKRRSMHHSSGTQPGRARPLARQDHSLDLEPDRGLLAAIALDLILDDLSVIERAQSGLLDSGNMNERVLAATRGLNESISFGRVEPLHGTSSHLSLRRLAPHMR